MKAATPPSFCDSAMMCWQTVVLPEELRAVDLDDAAAGNAAYAERPVQRQATGRDDLDIQGCRFAQLHDRAVAEAALDQGHRGLQRLVPFLAVHHAPCLSVSIVRRTGRVLPDAVNMEHALAHATAARPGRARGVGMRTNVLNQYIMRARRLQRPRRRPRATVAPRLKPCRRQAPRRCRAPGRPRRPSSWPHCRAWSGSRGRRR